MERSHHPTGGTKAALLLRLLAFAGYAAVLAHAQPARSSAAQTSSLAGQWRGQLTVGEGRTSELVLDLGLVEGRWVGQFDLSDFGVENYPVEVALEGRKVTLHLTAAQIDFEGTLSALGDSLAGTASTNGQHDPLILIPAGAAQFSSGFLALEGADNDSTLVEPLSADASQLRKRFNDDRAYTRLLMLLSPT